MDKGEYNEDVFTQPGYAWRYYVEAGTKLTVAFSSNSPYCKFGHHFPTNQIIINCRPRLKRWKFWQGLISHRVPGFCPENIQAKSIIPAKC